MSDTPRNYDQVLRKVYNEIEDTLDVSVKSSTLPTGGATEAKQDTQITLLSAIEDNTDAIESKLTGASTATLTNVSVTTTSTQILASNASRKMATFYNDGGGTVYLKLGTAASSTSFTIRLQDNNFYELPLPIYTGVIHAIAAAGTRAVRVTEY